jgi:cell division septation protein DedD
LTTHVQDDGFHEIQLNGKQLVFLFMAATVVSVVIFLCGVLVGRGVRGDRSSTSTDATTAAVIADATPQPAPVAAAVPAGSDPTSAAPPATVDDSLSYFNRLENSTTKENLKPVPPPVPERAVEPAARTARATPPPPAAVPKPATPAPKNEPVTAAAAAPAAPAPAGDGYAIQVAALREAGEADTIAKRLVSKGYGAYVLTPPDGRPNVYRVRVGTFKTRREAEAIASKLQKEEQFKPWITR